MDCLQKIECFSDILILMLKVLFVKEELKVWTTYFVVILSR